MKSVHQAIADGELSEGDWSWPVQIKMDGNRLLLRPLHLASRLADSYIIDKDADPEYYTRISNDD